MKNKTRWKKQVFALAMTAALSVTGVTAGPAVTAWATPASGTSVADNIVVRESAVSGAQVGGLSEGQAVSIEGETIGSDGNTWYQITYTVDGEERSGWVRGDLLETSDESLADADATDSDAEATEAEEEAVTSLEFETQNGSITLTDIPEDELSLVSDRFVEANLEFSEGVITALQLAEPDELVADDAAIVDFYYVYGYNEIGETGWYVYNADDGTIQKNLLNMQYSVAETEEAETETASDFSADSLTKMALSVLAVVGLLLLVLVIIFSVRYRRLRLILEEELEEDEELPRKKAGADSKQENGAEERGGRKTGKKAEKPEPVKVRRGSAEPGREETDDRMTAKFSKADAAQETAEPAPAKAGQKAAEPAPAKAGQKAAESAPAKAGQKAAEPAPAKAGQKAAESAPVKTGQTAEQAAKEEADETGRGRREKVSHKKKMKKENTLEQEAPKPEPISEIGGVDVMDLDSMDDLDFEALLNRYLEEDMAAGQDGTATETQDDLPAQDAGMQEDESDCIDLSKLKMPDDEPEYYDDDDDDLEFL